MSVLPLLALLASAQATDLDAHGALPPPDGAGLHGGFTTFEPGTLPGGTAAVTVLGEHFDTPLTVILPDGEERPLLGRGTGGTIGFAYALHDRVAVGAVVPIWGAVRSSSFGDPLAPAGTTVGDFEIWVPVSLLSARGARPALTLAPTLRGPGLVSPWLSDQAFGGGLTLAAANTHGRLGWTANLEGEWRNTRAGALVDPGPAVGGTGALSFALTPTLAPAVELRSAALPGGLGAELAGGLRATALDGRVGFVGGAARGLISGPGAARFRLWLGVTVASGRPEPRPIPVVEAPETPEPTPQAQPTPELPSQTLVVVDREGRVVRGATIRSAAGELGRTDHLGNFVVPEAVASGTPLLVWAEGYKQVSAIWAPAPVNRVVLPVEPTLVTVRAVNAAGAPIAVRAHWTGPTEPGAPERDELGNLRWWLEPGDWRLRLEGEGLASQERTFQIEATEVSPIAIDAVLHKPEGAGSATLRTQMPDGSAGPSGVVSVGGKTVGTLLERGTLTLSGLAEATSEVRIVSADRPEPVTVSLRPTADPATVATPAALTLAWLPGTVRVRALGPDGAVSDALIAFDGPASLRPARLGPDGERLFTLRPGDWDVLASSPALGSQVRSVRISAESSDVQEVVFQLRPQETGTATLHLQTVDPDGEPLEGVQVTLDGEPLGTTANRGALSLEGLDAGVRDLSLAGPMLRETQRTLRLVDGHQRADVVVAWAPGAVLVQAVDAAGKPVDARVAAAGPASVPSFQLGADGAEMLQLQPGPWEVLISDASLGMRSFALEVHPDDDRRQVVRARLTPVADEVAAAQIRVLGPDGQPVDGAEVWLDGELVGQTRAGRLDVRGLPPGRARVEARAPGLSEAFVVVDLSARPEPHPVELSLGWAPGLVDLSVYDAAGAPLADALVAAEGARRVAPVRTDSAGRARLHLAPGEWWLLISSDLGALELPLTLGERPEPTAATARLQPPPPGRGALVVHVRGPDGRPVPNARLLEGEAEIARTSGSGTAILDDRDPGPVVVRVEPPPGWLPGSLDLVIGEGTHRSDLTLAFRTHVVRLAVQDEGGQPIAATLWIEGPTGRAEHSLAPGQAITLPFAPGSWQVSATAPERSTASSPLLVDPERGAGPLTLALQRPRARIEGVQVRLDETVHFDLGRAELRPEAGPLLDQIAAVLLAHPELARVEVQGHTDDQGGLDANLALSRARADAVLAALVQRGVPPERLQAQGFGPLRPLAAGTSEDARARNRRVELKILEQREEAPAR